MKKMFLALLVLAFAGSASFAQQPQAKTNEVKTFTGKIESIEKRLGKPPKWEYARFTLLSDSAEKIIISAIKATAVNDAAGKDLTEGGKKFGGFSLKKGERVEIKYSTGPNGRNEAISIRCLD